MDLLPNEEQKQIVDACVQFLENELPVDRIRRVNDNTPLISRKILAQLAELGWFGLSLAEKQGGVGYTLKEEALLFVELGRYLVSPAVLGSVLGARVCAVSGNDELAQQIIAGEKLVGVPVALSDGVSISEKVTGEFYVFEAGEADFILVANEQASALVEKTSCKEFEPLVCMDEKVQMARVVVDGNASVVVASSQENIYLRGVLLTAAMQLGIAEATRDRSVQYAKEREQYGRPIGSFQAIKHGCADMAVKCESVMSMLYHAAIVLDQPHGPYGENFEFDTVAVKLLASQAAQDNANAAVQIHGGMGFTQEMDIHLFVKRAHVMDQLFGGKRLQSRRMIAMSGPSL